MRRLMNKGLKVCAFLVIYLAISGWYLHNLGIVWLRQ